MATACLFSMINMYSQGFQTREMVGNVFIVENPDLGSQVVVQSEKGLVVFDSFWSTGTEELFRQEIIRSLNRSDFAYIVNMVDRLDMIGGNAALDAAVVVGQDHIADKYRNGATVKEELSELVEMWREKEGYSRDRLQNLEAGSEEAREEQEWLNQCRQRADDLEHDFSLVKPQITYQDTLTLDLGNLSLHLSWFGETGNYRGLTVAVIPEAELAILSKSILFPLYHLAPYPQPDYGILDVPHWIDLLEEILEGDHAVSYLLLSDHNQFISTDRMKEHLEYIRKLWNSVRSLDNEGMDLKKIQDRLSLENNFSFVIEMQVYKDNGDFWIRPQHQLHVKLFYLQGKNLASELVKNEGYESIQSSLEQLRNNSKAYYFDEQMMDRIAFVWMDQGHQAEALEVYKLNAGIFPLSFRANFNLAEAYLKTGDKQSALASLKSCMELDPDNEAARETLKKLTQ